MHNIWGRFMASVLEVGRVTICLSFHSNGNYTRRRRRRI